MKYYVLSVVALAIGLGIGFGEDLFSLVSHGHLHRGAESDEARERDHEAASKADVFTWQGRVGSGGLVEIKGVSGAIEAHGTDGSEVIIRAEKTSKKGRSDEVRIEVIEHSDGVTVCSVYPSRRDRNSCGVGESGTLGSRNSDVVVTYHVEVPSGLAFRGVTVNGAISAMEMTESVIASSVNGALHIQTSGWGEGTTVNGSIEAEVGSSSPSGDLRFTTTNGSITVAVPSDISAAFEAVTMNGGIETAFPMMISGKNGPRRMEGILGTGGASVKLATVNGRIQLIERN
jgi:hypothetical protein